ncbi:uncharacterized protein LOC113279129 [Papaver somniferum]|uniref:uncharacterized protein LOC113279129 n=1 Tax=Papaver somniferum TaxID=3469 RepID=UPI000E70368C|nr:uncharacterized protein LOC113279129 [Papaver somniferum]
MDSISTHGEIKEAVFDLGADSVSGPDWFNDVPVCLRQTVSRQKSKFYYGGGSYSRGKAIANFWGIERALFPDRYLGVILKPGLLRNIYVRQVVEKTINKLDGWKGKLLLSQAMLVLVCSVISSYIVQSMVVYRRPMMMIELSFRSIRNFLWSGDSEKQKWFIVAYDI